MIARQKDGHYLPPWTAPRIQKTLEYKEDGSQSPITIPDPPERKGTRMALRTGLDEVFQRHYDELLVWSRRHIPRNLGEPEDFVHATYLRCRKHWAKGRGVAEREAAYFYRALRWVATDAWRRDRRAKSCMGMAVSPRGEDRTGEPLGRLVFEEALGSLKGRQRQVCHHRLAGKSDTEICRELRLSRGALAVYVHRAKAAICDFLEIGHPSRTSPSYGAA